MNQLRIPIYLFVGSMTLECTRPESCLHNQDSAIISDGDLSNAIVTYNIQRQHRLNVVNPSRPRHLKFDKINSEQFLELNDT